MKHVLTTWIAAAIVCTASQVAVGQTLFTYGKKAVSQQEFLKAFRKNPSNGPVVQAMQEYLPLYINYKLKVQYAYDEQLDTLPMQQDELYQYQLQLTESFINRQSNTNELVAEALRHSQHDRLVRHIAFAYQPGDAISEQKAKQQSAAARQQLQSKVPFTKVLQQYETDPETLQQGGSLGWITAFSLPYIYEKEIYSIQPGTTTSPIKGSDAYHLFWVEKERPALGKRKVAQILLWQHASASADEKKATRERADSIHRELQHGRLSFEQAALLFSNDRTSYTTGGVLPVFGVGEYDAAFEQQAFALTKPGQLSAPFETAHGLHILKLLESIAAPTGPDDDEAVTALQQKLLSTDRADIARQAFLKTVMKKMQLREENINKNALWLFTDSAIRNGSTKGMPVQNSTLLFSIGKEQTLAENWVMYNRAAGIVPTAAYAARYDAYIQQTANNYYRENIAQYEPDFAEQLQEFKDANLLFAAMEKQVWSKAANDTLALQQYYNSNKAKYVWQAGAAALMITATDSAAALAYQTKLMQQPSNWKALAESMNEQIITDSSRFETSQLPSMANSTFKPGTCSSMLHNSMDNSYSFVYIFAAMPGGDIRSFDEAKGWVINDYQQVLEQQWLSDLRKKYPVKINDAVWQTLLKSK